jgi:hypothetical protein
MKAVSLEKLKKELRHLDKTLEEGSNDWNAGLTLLSSVVVGPNIKKISKYTHIPRKKIIPISKRLRKNKIWVGGKLKVHDWLEKGGVIAFWLDVCVALGWLKRS